MKRSFGNRMIDFMGRAAFGGENGFARDKRLIVAAVGLLLATWLSGSWMFFIVLIGLILVVFVNDVRRYNREHGNG